MPRAKVERDENDRHNYSKRDAQMTVATAPEKRPDSLKMAVTIAPKMNVTTAPKRRPDGLKMAVTTAPKRRTRKLENDRRKQLQNDDPAA